MRITAIIAAAGSSTRMGSGTNKLMSKVRGRHIFEICLFNLKKIEVVNEIIIATSPALKAEFQKITEKTGQAGIKFVSGGATRSESVLNALKAAEDADYIMIHDAARPLLSASLASKMIEAIQNNEAVVPVLKSTDTLYHLDKESAYCLDRNKIFRIQTPQLFNRNSISIIRRALETENETYTDEASILLKNSVDIHFVKGSRYLHKLTYKEDLNYIESLYDSFIKYEAETGL